MIKRIMCAAAALAVSAAFTGCAERQNVQMSKKASETTYPEAVAADVQLDSALPTSSETAAESTAETEKNQESKKTEAPKKTETTTTTAEPEPEIPDIRRDQPYLGAAVNDDFADACFIGASQTVGLSVFGEKVLPDFYAYAGLNVQTVFTNDFLTDENGDPCTVLDKMDDKEYNRIYILFGLNELGGWIDYSQFYDGYVKLIDELKKLQPQAHIYIESVLPVNKYAVETNTIYTNENIDDFNSEYLRPIAYDTGCTYLNVNPLFKCENGSLARDAAGDGIHLTAAYCLEWLDMLAYYTPPEGPRDDLPQDYIPQPESSTQEETGELPAEVIPQNLPEVIIPDVTEAPPAQTDAVTDDTQGYTDEEVLW